MLMLSSLIIIILCLWEHLAAASHSIYCFSGKLKRRAMYYLVVFVRISQWNIEIIDSSYIIKNKDERKLVEAWTTGTAITIGNLKWKQHQSMVTIIETASGCTIIFVVALNISIKVVIIPLKWLIYCVVTKTATEKMLIRTHVEHLH